MNKRKMVDAGHEFGGACSFGNYKEGLQAPCYPFHYCLARQKFLREAGAHKSETAEPISNYSAFANSCRASTVRLFFIALSRYCRSSSVMFG